MEGQEKFAVFTGASAASIEDAVRRIVAASHPDRLILFGSAARGETGPDSDLDFLVVKAGVAHRRKLAQKIYGSLFGLGVPVDIIVVTPEDIELYKNDPGSIIAPAVSQGREVYAAR